MDKKRIWGIVGFLAIVVIIFAFIMHQSDQKYIDLVKQGSPTSYPNITYEQAFNHYFGNCKWSYFVSDDKEDVVEFNGKCSYRGQDADIKIQFVLDMAHDSFEVYAATINDIPQSNWELTSIIELVFEDY